VVALAAVMWQRGLLDRPRRAAMVLGASLLGFAAVIVFSAFSAHDPVAFLSARSGWRGHRGTGYIPYTLKHPVTAVHLVADEISFSPVPDNGTPAITGVALPWSLGFYEDLLLPPLAWASWRVNRDLGSWRW